jgi:uncharacterized protein YjdB
MEEMFMKHIQRYLSAFLCLVMLMTGVCAFSEEAPAPAATDEPASEPTSEPTEEPATPTPEPATPTPEPATPTPEPATPTPEPATPTPEPELTTELPAEPTAEPTAEPELRFKKDRLEFGMSEFGPDFDYAEKFALKISGASGKVAWKSGDESIAAFVDYDRHGEPADKDTPADEITTVFEVYAPGEVKITARLDGMEAEFTLVIKDDIEDISLAISAGSARVGDVVTVTAADENGEAIAADEIDWNVDGECARMDENGSVTCISEGSATISARYMGAEAACTLDIAAPAATATPAPTESSAPTATPVPTVTPVPITGITVPDVEVYSNSTQVVTVHTLPDSPVDPAEVKFTVAQGSEKYITIDDSGVVTPVTRDGVIDSDIGVAAATVNVEYRGFTASARVNVLQAATGILVERDPIEAPWGATTDLASMVRFTPDTCVDGAAQFASENEGILAVDPVSGEAVGVNRGSTAVKIATLSGAEFTFAVRVVAGSASLKIVLPEGNLKVGTTVQLALERSPADADDTIIWTSSDAEIAAVDENGAVSLKKVGTVNITAASVATGAEHTATLNIIRPAEKITIYDDVFKYFTGFTLAVGQSVSPTINVLPDEADGGYTVTSSNSGVLRASESGRLTAVKTGTVNVKIESADGEVSRNIVVKVVKASKAIRTLRISSSKVSLKEGTTKRLSSSVNSGAYSKTVLWGSADTSVAKVNKSGKITAVAPGKTTIYAMTLSGVGKKIKVTVTEQLPSSVRLSTTSISKYADKQVSLKVTVSPSNVSEENRKITWSSSNTRVAMVDRSGVVYTIAPGSATITAKTVNGKTARCKVTVKKRKVSSVELTNPYGDLQVGGTYTLEAEVRPESATKKKLSWSFADSSSRKRAIINSSTGEIYCKKAGKIKVRATAADGSGERDTITLKIVSVPLESLTVTRDGAPIGENSTIELAYKDSFTAVAEVKPAMYIEWESSDSRVVSVKDGLITATGAGTAAITVTAAGTYTFKFNVKVPRDGSLPRYRALVIGQYRDSSENGYLPFSSNCTTGVRDAFRESDIGGGRYSVVSGGGYTTATQVTNAITSTFRDAKPGDVSVIYMLSHGTMSGSTYRWHLQGRGSKATYVSGSQIVSAMKEIEGNVVLVICSCYSGGDENNSSSVPGMVRAADRAAADGTSYSVICANDGMHKSSFVDTIEHRSYDFFSHAFCQSLGWNLVTDSSMSVRGDKDGDGYVTVSELANSAKSITIDEIDAYIEKYGSVGFNGADTRTQVATYYISPEAGDLAIFSK